MLAYYHTRLGLCAAALSTPALPNQAVLSNLSFAFWPDNARAGMALLEAPAGAFRPDGSQALSPEWFKLYLAWNANFIWPSHYCADMMCFTML